MKTEPLIGLYPLNDCVLVELKQSSKNFSIKEGKYDTRTEGIVVRVPDKGFELSTDNPFNVANIMPLKELMGKRIHFEEFKEGARIKRDSKIYSFIKIEDIRGYEDEV
jgi:co-chaperonin GroES (HSP10)